MIRALYAVGRLSEFNQENKVGLYVCACYANVCMYMTSSIRPIQYTYTPNTYYIYIYYILCFIAASSPWPGGGGHRPPCESAR